MTTENTYFANKDSMEKVSILMERSKTFYNRMETNDHIHKIRNMWRAYHGIYSDSGHEITFTGEQGELVDLPVNHFRNLARHMYTMITSSRPVMECRAINSDYKSLAQTYIGNSILDYYMREKGLEDALYRALENAITTTTGYIKLDWNATAGESYDIDPETGEFNYEGEIEFSTPTFLDVVFDGTMETWNPDWLVVRSSKNKYDLAAKYPEFADKIKELASKNEETNQSLSIFSNDQTDHIYYYEFFHRKTESVPEGNYCLYLSNDIVLIDTILPYKEIPVYRVVPSEFLGTCYGYTPLFDLYPIQEAINSLYGVVLTNQNAFGVQSVFIERGADITMSGVQGGLNLIEGNKPPIPIQLTQTPNEIFKLISDLIGAQETISGISSVTRGQAPANLESGAALAMVQSMSLQFISSLQQSYVRLIESTGTGLINILKDYANTPKLVALVGKNNRVYLNEFTGEMISKINRVVVDVGNPLAKTTAGRVQMAEQLAQMKLLRTPEQYFQVIKTGQLETAFEGETGQLMLIKRENEELMAGKEARAIFLDKHRMHIQEHSSILSDPALRFDPVLFEKVKTHIQEHIDLLKTTDPELLAMIGEQPLGQPQAAPQGDPSAAPGMEGMSGPPGPEGVAPAQPPSGTPSPPPPFENLPTDPSQMGPQ